MAIKIPEKSVSRIQGSFDKTGVINEWEESSEGTTIRNK